MGFLEKIKRDVLVASARYCCVCHRFKGVKVEVHHIIPVSKGGSDDFDNAIALCFDCHADAGHYNPDHPRGTKYSPKELRAQRDAWYEIVQRDNIEGPSGQDLLYCRYLLCENYEALVEISERDLESFPIKKALLIDNVVLAFQKRLISANPHRYRHDSVCSRSYKNKKTYMENYPDARTTEKAGVEYPYFEVIRKPTKAELLDKVAPEDGVTRALLEDNVPIEDIASVLAYWELCGDDRFQEIYRVRPLRGAFIAVTNVSKRLIRLNSINGIIENPRFVGFRQLSDAGGGIPGEISLPNAQIQPDSTVVIPVATVLSPLQGIPSEAGAGSTSEEGHAHFQTFTHINYDVPSTNSFSLIGPAMWPSSIQLEIDGKVYEQPVHSLDLTNLYTIDRYWEMGSCPHMFFGNTTSGSVWYAGELFSKEPGRITETQFRVPADVNVLIVAELENESTHIKSIFIDGILSLSDSHLQENDYVIIPVSSTQLLRMIGCYFPTKSEAALIKDPWRRNELVSRFLGSFNFSITSSPLIPSPPTR